MPVCPDNHALDQNFLVNFITNLLPAEKENLDASFKECDFTRRRKLPLPITIALLINMVRPGERVGYQNVIDRFFSETELAHNSPCFQPPDKSAFIKARRKLPTEALMDIFERAVRQASVMAGKIESTSWRGFRVVAIDGTTKNLPYSEDLVAQYGTPFGAHYPQLLTGALYDVLAKIPLNLMWGAHTSSERNMALELIKDLGEGDLLLLDRGFPSFELFAALLARGIDFMIRLPDNGLFKTISDYFAAGHRDGIITLEPPEPWVRECKKNGKPHPKAIILRAIKIKLAAGKSGVFVTTLRDKKQYPASELRELYHLRWEEEEFFKLIKELLEGENFRGKSVQFIDQEILAIYLYIVLVRIMMMEAAAKFSLDIKEIAQKPAFLAVARFLDNMLLAATDEECLKWYQRCLAEISWRKYKKRPNRSYPRKSQSSFGKWGRR